MSITITFSDGTELSGLELNGNCFISQTPVTKESLEGKLSRVTISGDAGKYGDKSVLGEHGQVEFLEVPSYDGKHWFGLRDIPQEELEMAQIKANIAYTAMMSGVDLDE